MTSENTTPTRRRRLAPGEPTPCPFVVLIDQREQSPLPFTGISEQPENRDPRKTPLFSFESIESDANKKHRVYSIEKRILHLPTADYSLEIDGDRMDSRIVIERKSIPDLFMSVGAERDRFEAEHERMAKIVRDGGHAFLVIEGNWNQILLSPPPQCQLSPKTVWRTAISWAQKYGVQWWAPGGRRTAELFTFRALEKFWERHVESQKQARKQAREDAQKQEALQFAK